MIVRLLAICIFVIIVLVMSVVVSALILGSRDDDKMYRG